MTNTSMDFDRRRALAADAKRAIRTRLIVCASALVLMSVMGSDAASARTPGHLRQLCRIGSPRIYLPRPNSRVGLSV